MTAAITYQGGCLCGSIRFEAIGEPNSVSTCHCRSCQRAAGADSVAWAEYPVKQVAWSGTDALAFDSSPNVRRTFCKQCGSSLSYQIKEDSIDLTLVCFDDPECFAPEREIWLDHRRSWNPRNRELPGYEGFRSIDSDIV